VAAVARRDRAALAGRPEVVERRRLRVQVRQLVPAATSSPSASRSPSEAAMSSDARSPIMTVGAAVLPDGMTGMIDASATRSPSTPRTRSSGSTTASSPVPIRHVPTGCA
jgi:hypothetical protein